MINKLGLCGFKCFKDPQEFKLSKLNLFTGFNGRGKSTVFQSLLMLAQSLYSNGTIEKLKINGQFVRLGLFDDIVSFKNTEKKVSFNIDSDIDDIKTLELGYKELDDRNGAICNLVANGVDFFTTKAEINTELKAINFQRSLANYPQGAIEILLSNFYYISADRLGPTMDEIKDDVLKDNPVGTRGEHRLITLSSQVKTNGIRFNNKEKNDDKSLIKEVNKWLDYIMDGAKIEIKGKEKDWSVLQLILNKVKAVNTGFGLSYILAIIVTALIAPKGSCVFIENPEAHLHPRAQARLTELLCKMAELGIQVFIETHSEHIVNGARLAALKNEIDIKPKDISIHFFDEDYSVKPLEIEDNGQISNWPEGFFDQQEKDLSEILKNGLLKC
jgi:predicted ATPase